uniref:HesB/IscA family protein n=1 Tax=Argonema antarcticum TaxID=2942763 RepID=UPI0030DA9F5C
MSVFKTITPATRAEGILDFKFEILNLQSEIASAQTDPHAHDFFFFKSMIHLSASAASEVKRLRAKLKQHNALFRLSVGPGGCSGMLYTMEFDDSICETNLGKTEIASGDCVYDCNGLQVVVEAQSLPYVDGLTLDYSEDLMGGGFRFHNPNATQTCGCGNSFSIDR